MLQIVVNISQSIISMNFLLEFRHSQQWVHAKNSVGISNFICVCWCSLLNFLQGFSVYITSLKVFHGCFTVQKRLVFYFFFAKFDRSGSDKLQKNEKRDENEIIAGWVIWAEYWARPIPAISKNAGWNVLLSSDRFCARYSVPERFDSSRATFLRNN